MDSVSESDDKKMVAQALVEDIEALENAEDIEEARLALKEIKEKGSISLAEIKKRLG